MRINEETSPSNKIDTSSQKVEFKGVSFTYNPQILGEITSEELTETLLAKEGDKPDYVAPHRIRFKLRKPNQPREATITIYSIADFRRVWAPVEKFTTKFFDKDLNDLRKVIKDTDFRADDEIPFIPYVDASQTFQAKVKKFPFPNGEGVFFLTQIDTEPSLVNNEGLTYIFQGISSDEKNYILAEFPVGVSFLPKNYDATEFEGYRLSPYFSADKSNERKYKQYVLKIRERLEKTPPDNFEPILNGLEELISSLKIER